MYSYNHKLYQVRNKTMEQNEPSVFCVSSNSTKNILELRAFYSKL